MHQYLLGIDIGTSGCKSIIVDDHGQVAAEAYCGYEMSVPRAGWCEQAPQDWWSAVKQTVQKLLRDFRNADDIVSIGLSGQMHGMVLLDRDGEVLRPCILWCDQRTESQCRTIYDKVGGEEELLKLTNNKMLTGYTGGKILWVRENEPHIFEKAAMILNPKDYVRFRLTGEFATEVSDASGTGLFDVRKREWSYQLLDILEIPHDLIPPCYESTEITGRLSKKTASELGLPDGLPVVGGGGDAIVQSVGSGLVRSGILGATIGTGGQICAALDNCVDNYGGRLQVFCNVMPGKWHAMGVMTTAGGALKWLKDLLYEFTPDYQKENIYEILDQAASGISPGSNGLIFLPYLSGERCPYNDPHARGAFIGLTLKHKKAHLIRSVLEGVALGLKGISNLFDSISDKHDKLYLSGGVANSDLWKQIIADALNIDVVTMKAAAYGGAYGAALIAGTGLGVWSSVEEAADALSKDTEIKPIKQNVEIYNELYPIFHNLYKSLANDFKQISYLNL